LSPEQSSSVTKLMSLVRNLPGAKEDMNSAVETYLKSHPGYLRKPELLSKMESDDPDFYELTTLSEELMDGDWDDEDDVPELMDIFKTECLDKVIAKLEETITSKELATRHGTVESELTVLKDFSDMDATSKQEVEALLTEVLEFKPENITVAIDQRQAKVAEFETKYKELFVKYRTSAIEKLQTEKFNTGEYDASTLVSIEKPSEFKTKVAEMRDKKKAEDDTISATEGTDETIGDAIGDAISTGQTGLQGILDRLMQSKNGFLATLAAAFVALLNFNPGGMFDGLIGTMSPSETKEVFLDLITNKQKVISHPKDGDEAVTFKTFKENQTAATTWLENLIVGGNKVGKKEALCYSLFNTEFTVAKLKELAKNGNDKESLDVEDLPSDYQADFEIVKAIYDQVVAKAPSDGSQDTLPLAEFIADPANGFIQSAPRVADASQA